MTNLMSTITQNTNIFLLIEKFMKMKSIVMLLVVCMVVMAAAGPSDKNDDSDMAELTKDQRVCIADHIRADGNIFAGFINILRELLSAQIQKAQKAA